MAKVVGFLIESASAIPYQQMLSAALRHRVYVIDGHDHKLCEIHRNVLHRLQEDEWQSRKFDVLDNLSYFLDPRRTEHCDLTVKVSNALQFEIGKRNE
jgi:hypothetical protein